MSAPGQQFSLKWNNFSQHIVSAFEDLRGDDEFTDVTLSCDGKRIKCHKVLLSACSVYFKETFRENPCKHPVIILKGVEFVDLSAVVTFMYNGQVNISQERLSTFLQTAELLQIKGLTEMNDTEEAPTVKKRSHTAGNTEPPIPNLSHSLKSSDGSSLITPEILTARPPTPKRKRIGPASFMQMQNQSHINNDSQVPVTTQAGSSFHSSSSATNLERGSGGLSVMDGTPDAKAVAGPSSGVSSSTGGFINPETVIIPSTSMLDPSTHLSSSNDSYSHGIIKFEEEDMLDEDDDYEKNLSEDNDNSLHDMLGNVEHEQGSMGSFMAGPSGQGIKIVNVGTDSSAHGAPYWTEQPVTKMTLTSKGRPKLWFENFAYVSHGVTKDGSKESWRCARATSQKCRGRIFKRRNGEIGIVFPHSVQCCNKIYRGRKRDQNPLPSNLFLRS